MSVESDFRAFLIADVTIVGLVSTRIYGHDLKPQNTAFPAITLQRSDTEFTMQQPTGQSGFQGVNFQVDSWAEEYDTVHSVREAVIARCQNFNGTMGSTAVSRVYVTSGPVDVYEQSVEQYRSSVGVVIWLNS